MRRRFDPLDARNATMPLADFTAALEAEVARIWNTITTPQRRGYDPTLDGDQATRMSKAGRSAQRSVGYGGLKVDEYGREADGSYHPALDGGGQ